MNILMAVGFIAIPVAAVAVGVALRARHNVKEIIEREPIQLHFPTHDEEHFDQHVGHIA